MPLRPRTLRALIRVAEANLGREILNQEIKLISITFSLTVGSPIEKADAALKIIVGKSLLPPVPEVRHIDPEDMPLRILYRILKERY